MTRLVILESQSQIQIFFACGWLYQCDDHSTLHNNKPTKKKGDADVCVSLVPVNRGWAAFYGGVENFG